MDREILLTDLEPDRLEDLQRVADQRGMTLDEAARALVVEALEALELEERVVKPGQRRG